MAEFLAVATAHFLALISPGPDFFIIISTALRNGSARTTITCAGIAAANGVYILLALIGFSMVREHAWVLTGMKFAGAAFLCYIGYMLIRSYKRELFQDSTAGHGQDTALKLFTTGFVSAILNPKNPIFYISLYSLFIRPSTPSLTQGLYGLWMFSAVFFWDIFIAFSIGNRRIRDMLSTYTHRIEQASGFIIITLGIAIALG